MKKETLTVEKILGYDMTNQGLLKLLFKAREFYLSAHVKGLDKEYLKRHAVVNVDIFITLLFEEIVMKTKRVVERKECVCGELDEVENLARILRNMVTEKSLYDSSQLDVKEV